MPMPTSRASRRRGQPCNGEPMPAFETNRRVAFTSRQMFDLVADVEQYPKFFPLCEALRVQSRETRGETQVLMAEMTVGYVAIRETIVSRVTLEPQQLRVAADLVDGPFKKLQNRWRFVDAPGGCDVHFGIDYEFKSFMLQMLVGAVFEQAFRRCTEAFEARAREVYGAPTTAA